MLSSPCFLFDWGDTLMKVFPEYAGPMSSWPRLEAMPQAVETLRRLKAQGCYLALATNAADSSEAEIRQALARVGLDEWLDAVYCYRKIRHKKPSPEFFEFILEDLNLLGIERSQVTMVGDDLDADVRGALACGLQAVWFHPSGGAAPAGARIITALSEL